MSKTVWEMASGSEHLNFSYRTSPALGLWWLPLLSGDQGQWVKGAWLIKHHLTAKPPVRDASGTVALTHPPPYSPGWGREP